MSVNNSSSVRGRRLVQGGRFLANVPIIAVFYACLFVQLPRLTGLSLDTTGATRPENVVFWAGLAGATYILCLLNWRLIDRRFFATPAMLSLITYVLFAAASVTWAYNPEVALKAVILHAMIISCIVLPFALPIPLERATRRLTVCFAVTIMVNALYVLTTPASSIGHYGIYDHKQLLGTITSLGMILIAGDLFRRGILLRAAACIVLAVGLWLMFESKSKGGLAFLVLAPLLAGFVLVSSKYLRVRPWLLVAILPITCTLLSINTELTVSREAYRLYGDYSVTGRTMIWEFMSLQISRAPWFGWGFHSYWLVPNSPHLMAPGFVKDMVSSHSGYLELRLETGAIGHAIFMVFVYTSLRGLQHVRQESFIYAWVLLSVGLFTILVNLFESIWLSLTPMWLVFLVLAAELNRIVVRSSAGNVQNPSAVAYRTPMRRFANTGRARPIRLGPGYTGQ